MLFAQIEYNFTWLQAPLPRTRAAEKDLNVRPLASLNVSNLSLFPVIFILWCSRIN